MVLRARQRWAMAPLQAERVVQGEWLRRRRDESRCDCATVSTVAYMSGDIDPWALPDFNRYPTDRRVVAATTNGVSVTVQWDDGAQTEHHRFVLRENSPDPATTHPLSREQQVQLTELPPELRITSAAPDEHGGLRVRWSQHDDFGEVGRLDASTFHPGWLRAWAHGMAAPVTLAPMVTWDASLNLLEHRFDGAAVLAGDQSELQHWLTSIHTHGVGILEDLPVDQEMIQIVPSMIGPVRSTNFGDAFDVRTKTVDVTSNAYTDLELPVHTDLDTREYMPGLQFLFCMVNDAGGGESRLTDAAHLTEHLRQHEPEAFDALTTIPVHFINKAQDTDYRHVSPFLVVDHEGQLVEARWSPWLRGPLDSTMHDAERFYASLRLALTLADSAAFVVTTKLAPGEMLGFDNRRLLHGRGPVDRSSGERWLRGCYVEREELRSRLRVAHRGVHHS